MDSINDRVMFLIQELGHTKTSFSRAVGKGSNVIQGIVGKRGSKPNADTLAEIIMAFPEINADWLLTGKGKPFKIDISKVDIKDFRERYNKEYINMYQWNPGQDKQINELEQKINNLEFIIETKDKQLEDKDKIIEATQKVIKVLEEFKERIEVEGKEK